MLCLRMSKRRAEMLAYSDVGPIVLSLFHPGWLELDSAWWPPEPQSQ